MLFMAFAQTFIWKPLLPNRIFVAHKAPIFNYEKTHTSSFPYNTDRPNSDRNCTLCKKKKIYNIYISFKTNQLRLST